MFEIILKNVSQQPNSITIDYEKVVENFMKKMLLHSTKFVLDLIDYFEDHYVARPVRGSRPRCPRFSISTWNGFDRLDKQLPRTNNSAEG